MAGFPWLPIGFDLGEVRSGRLVSHGTGYQVIADGSGDMAILLLKPAALPASAALERFRKELGQEVTLGKEAFLYGVFSMEDAPIRIIDMPTRIFPIESGEMLQVTNSLLFHLQTNDDLNWSTSIFIERMGICIPTEASDDHGERLANAVSIMTGGVRDPGLSVNQIRHLNPWVTADDIGAIFAILKPGEEDGSGEAAVTTTDALKASGTGAGQDKGNTPAGTELPPFHLAGQPTFSRMINEYVVDQIRDRARYRAMGVRMPNAILLAGPKGSGKTYAVKKLAAHIKWAVFEVGLGDVGSPYIHQTTRNLKSLFDAAERKGGALIVLNEIDALTGNRGTHSNDHKIEEINEMLRLIENAGERNILVIGTTNRVDGIDEAFLRKGRFDIQIDIVYPGADQVQEILEAMLTQRPHMPSLNLDSLIAKLKGRPVSDIEWVINEAARMAVKGHKSQIDDICLFGALAGLPK